MGGSMAASQRLAGGSGRGEPAKRCVEIRLKMQEFFQAHQLHGLHDPGIADHQELGAGLVALLGQLHQGTETGGIDEVDAAEVNHQGELAWALLAGDERIEVLVGIGIQLSREAEQEARCLPFTAPSKRDGQSLQVRDGSVPFERCGLKCRDVLAE
jgi:hypothetical protein